MAQELGLPPPAVVAAADREDYYPCNLAGFWEQAVDAGDDVVKGQLLGRVHFPTTPHLEPEEYFAHRDGYVIATRAITPTVRCRPRTPCCSWPRIALKLYCCAEGWGCGDRFVQAHDGGEPCRRPRLTTAAVAPATSV